MRWSIRRQFLMPLVLLMLGLVGVCAWAALDAARTARRRVARQMHDIAHTLSEGKYPLTPEVLEQVKGLSGAEFLLLDPSGKRLATFAGETGELPPAAPFLPADEPRLGQHLQIDGRGYLGRGLVLRPPHLNAGGRLYVLYPESLLDEALWHAVRPTLILGASAGLAALLLTAIGVRGVVRRVSDLERRTRAIAAGDFSLMPLPRTDDELRDLARSVNEMAAKLAVMQETLAKSERMRLLGQVSTGLAHQLRNAVTGAKLAVQLHAQTCSSDDRESLAVAERQLMRMTADLKRFFDLGQEGTQRAECSLDTMITEAVNLLEPQCRHAEITLRWSPPERSVVVTGDSGQLSHLVLNLITNAAEAAGPSGDVSVELFEESSKCILTVWDTGPGPPPEVATRLFEPFVTGKPEGVGLGLSVSRQVAEAHGGSITWGRAQDRTWFRVELARS